MHTITAQHALALLVDVPCAVLGGALVLTVYRAKPLARALQRSFGECVREVAFLSTSLALVHYGVASLVPSFLSPEGTPLDLKRLALIHSFWVIVMLLGRVLAGR